MSIEGDEKNVSTGFLLHAPCDPSLLSSSIEVVKKQQCLHNSNSNLKATLKTSTPTKIHSIHPVLFTAHFKKKAANTRRVHSL
jgi:hypothetical protein